MFGGCYLHASLLYMPKAIIHLWAWFRGVARASALNRCCSGATTGSRLFIPQLGEQQDWALTTTVFPSPSVPRGRLSCLGDFVRFWNTCIVHERNGYRHRKPGTSSARRERECKSSLIRISSQGPVKSSGLRPPAKYQIPSSPTRNAALSELTDSASNSRGAMGPPTTGSIKHKPSGCKCMQRYIVVGMLIAAVPEPPSKQRKTLQERAAEPLNSKQPAPPSTRPVNNAVKNTAMNGMRGFSASTSRVPSVNTSKHASAPSFGNSVGHGSRVPSANSYHRSKSAYGHSRSKSHHQASRPGTSMAQNEDDDRPELKGAYPISISTNPTESQHLLNVTTHSSREPPQNRILSLEPPRKRNLSGTPTRSSSSLSYVGRPLSLVIERPANTDGDVLESFGALSLGSPAPEARSRCMGRGTASGKNPDISLKSKISSLIPRATPIRQMGPPPCIQTPTRPKRQSTPSNPTPRFLSRFTNDLAPVFDTESRMEAMEREFTAFKQKMEGETTQATDLKETIKMLQSRGMVSSCSKHLCLRICLLTKLRSE